MLSGRDNVFRLSSWRQDGEASAGADPGASDVELSMREAGLQQVQAGHLQILSLGLVDGYGVGEANGKLQPLELDGEIRRNNGNPRNEGVFALGAASHDGGLDDVRHEGLDNEPCSIAKPWSIQVAK